MTKVASCGKQVVILLWKSARVMWRSKLGILSEWCYPFVMASFLLVMRHYIERIKFTSAYEWPRNVLDLGGPPQASPVVASSFSPSMLSATFADVTARTLSATRNLVLYYPANEFVRRLVVDAMRHLAANNPRAGHFTPKSRRGALHQLSLFFHSR